MAVAGARPRVARPLAQRAVPGPGCALQHRRHPARPGRAEPLVHLRDKGALDGSALQYLGTDRKRRVTAPGAHLPRAPGGRDVAARAVHSRPALINVSEPRVRSRSRKARVVRAGLPPTPQEAHITAVLHYPI